jgi:hypothetical protein
MVTAARELKDYSAGYKQLQSNKETKTIYVSILISEYTKYVLDLSSKLLFAFWNLKIAYFNGL